MKRAILSAALALVFAAGVSAQDKPHFAGKWKAAGSFTAWTITVEGSTMTVTRTIAGNSESTVYMLDGTPSKNPLDGGLGEIVMTSTWEGDVLVTTITAPAMTRIERRSIEADGTMKVQTTITIMQGRPAPPPPPGAGGPQVFKRVG
jgi:hypothetical protein